MNSSGYCCFSAFLFLFLFSALVVTAERAWTNEQVQQQHQQHSSNIQGTPATSSNNDNEVDRGEPQKTASISNLQNNLQQHEARPAAGR